MEFTPTTPSATGTFAPSPDEDALRQITYGDTPPLDGSVTYDQMIAQSGFMTPTVRLIPAPFTPTT